MEFPGCVLHFAHFLEQAPWESPWKFSVAGSPFEDMCESILQSRCPTELLSGFSAYELTVKGGFRWVDRIRNSTYRAVTVAILLALHWVCNTGAQTRRSTIWLSKVEIFRKNNTAYREALQKDLWLSICKISAKASIHACFSLLVGVQWPLAYQASLSLSARQSELTQGLGAVSLALYILWEASPKLVFV